MDTNVLISALRSKQGASFKLLSLIDSKLFQVNISVPLFVEYEAVAKRSCHSPGLEIEDIDAILNYIAKVSNHREVFFLWRPFLKDPKDDLVLEVAVESESDFIITYNRKDFSGVEKFGIRVLTPKEFLQLTGVIEWEP